jgi:hypothetical protein
VAILDQVKAFAQACGLSPVQVELVAAAWTRLHESALIGVPVPELASGVEPVTVPKMVPVSSASDVAELVDQAMSERMDQQPTRLRWWSRRRVFVVAAALLALIALVAVALLMIGFVVDHHPDLNGLSQSLMIPLTIAAAMASLMSLIDSIVRTRKTLRGSRNGGGGRQQRRVRRGDVRGRRPVAGGGEWWCPRNGQPVEATCVWGGQHRFDPRRHGGAVGRCPRHADLRPGHRPCWLRLAAGIDAA